MKIDKQKIAELASLSDDKLWAEIVSIGAAHGFNMPRAVPPHAELEKLRAAVSGDKMKLFHLEMWVYVHGIATMFATGFLDLEWDLISKMMSDCYQGLKKQYGLEE